ncbi:hypothetical protein ACFPYI_04655 [Halomarina salina]|uniref:Uncharacterized protein n=1 Tax=Halomarina salina TaxID=1872699 RepID=A0ABD5RJ32_9EURY|nr:hypothetical protein [Halomarina salina]
MALRIHSLLLVAVLLTAGCLGGSSGAPPSATDETTVETTRPDPTPPTARWTEQAGPNGYPDPPSTLTNQSATQAALQYEETFVLNALAASDVDSYGLGGVFGAETTVLDRADGGVYVRVRRGYSWTRTVRSTVDGTQVAEQSNADLTAEATYFVSTEAIRRVDGTAIRT